jgi:hypothetical protein
LSNSRQVGPQRRGAGSSPARFRIHHTVEGATRYPSPVVHRGCVDTLWVPNRSSTAVTCGIAGVVVGHDRRSWWYDCSI